MKILSQSKVDKSVLAVLKSFADKLPSLQTQVGAYNKCKFVSYEAVLFLRQQGIQAQLVHIKNYKGSGYNNPHLKWLNKGRDKWSHYVVAIDDMTFDFTIKQFDTTLPVPYMQSLDDLTMDWNKVGYDVFLNTFVDEIQLIREA